MIQFARRGKFSPYFNPGSSPLAHRIRSFSSKTKTEHLKPGQTHYSLLGLERNATRDQIQAGFFLAKEFHIDDAQMAGLADSSQAAERLANLETSYSVLMDRELKKLYDSEFSTAFREEIDVSEHWREHQEKQEQLALQKRRRFSTKGLGIGRDTRKNSKPGSGR